MPPDKLDDGGAAFPISREQDGWYEAGMSLRDYFAAKIMAAMIVADANKSASWDNFAQDAYWIADMMIAERRKTTVST